MYIRINVICLAKILLIDIISCLIFTLDAYTIIPILEAIRNICIKTSEYDFFVSPGQF